MDPKNIDAIFGRAQERSAQGGLELTPEETERFKSAFQDPEFMKLMSEYVQDLQNPEYRAETETYISQLEGENKVPTGKELVRPIPGFVAKTHKSSKVSGNGGKEKIFLNIVSSEKILAPSKTDTDKGQHWSLPYSIGPPHMEADHSGASSAAFDCCFHPDALRRADESKHFKSLLVKTAIEGVQEAFKRQKQDVVVDPDFHILKGVTYKSGQVPAMLIDVSVKKETWNAKQNMSAQQAQQKVESSPPLRCEVIPTPTPDEVVTTAKESGQTSAASASAASMPSSKPAAHATTVKTGAGKGLAIQKGFLTKSAHKPLYPEGSSEGGGGLTPAAPPTNPLISEVKPGTVPKLVPANPSAAAASSAPASVPGLVERASRRTDSSTSSHPPIPAPALSAAGAPTAAPPSEATADPKVPKYHMKERGVISMGDFEGVAKAARIVSSNRPAELVCTFELPKVIKASMIQLDISERLLKLSYVDVYDCSVRLPYPVIDKQGSAKYDKGSKTLVVTLPVQPHSHSLPDTLGSIDPAPEAGVEREEAIESAPLSSTKSKPSSKPVHDRWVSGSQGVSGGSETTDTSEESESARLAREIAERAREAQEAYAARKAAEEEAKARLPSGSCNPPISEDSTDEGLDFISAPKFLGAKPGFVFRNGDFGVGYYKDVYSSRRQPETAGNPSDSVVKTTSDDSSKVSSFMFEYRQTRDTVTVLVQVANIVHSSVKASFSPSGVRITFMAVGENDKMISYGMGLKTTQPINPAECKYDVADMNMVVALFKQTPGYWLEDEEAARKLSPFAEELQQRLPQPISILIPEEVETASSSLGEHKEPSKSSSSIDPALPVSVPSADAEARIPSAARSNPSAMRFHAQALLDLD